jgi:hypothetical protein
LEGDTALTRAEMTGKRPLAISQWMRIFDLLDIIEGSDLPKRTQLLEVVKLGNFKTKFLESFQLVLT